MRRDEVANPLDTSEESTDAAALAEAPSLETYAAELTRSSACELAATAA